jgi:hypothetical protein
MLIAHLVTGMIKEDWNLCTSGWRHDHGELELVRNTFD